MLYYNAAYNISKPQIENYTTVRQEIYASMLFRESGSLAKNVGWDLQNKNAAKYLKLKIV